MYIYMNICFKCIYIDIIYIYICVTHLYIYIYVYTYRGATGRSILGTDPQKPGCRQLLAPI